jgi:hypothetical protein
MTTIEKHHADCRLQSDFEVMQAADAWLQIQDTQFFQYGVIKQVYRWDKCLGVQGGCVER